MEEKVKHRKVRSDKKKEIKPIVKIEFYNLLQDLSYISNKPIKDIANYFCEKSFSSKDVIGYISHKYLKRDYWIVGAFFHGDPSLNHSRIIRVSAPKHEVSMKISQQLYNELENFAYCTGFSNASSCKLLLENTLLHLNIIESFLKEYTSINQLDKNRKKVLRGLLKFVKKNSPFPNNDITYKDLLSLIINEAREQYKL